MPSIFDEIHRISDFSDFSFLLKPVEDLGGSILYEVTPLCDPTGSSLPGSTVHGIIPGKNTGVGCHFLLQGIFPTQGSNLRLLHCRQPLYRLSHQGSPMGGTISSFLFSMLLVAHNVNVTCRMSYFPDWQLWRARALVRLPSTSLPLQ